MASPSTCIDIHGVALFIAEKHMNCVFFIVKDNIFTLSHSAMIAKSLLTPSWRLMALEPLENKLVSSANNTGSSFLHTINHDVTYDSSSLVGVCVNSDHVRFWWYRRTLIHPVGGTHIYQYSRLSLVEVMDFRQCTHDTFFIQENLFKMSFPKRSPLCLGKILSTVLWSFYHINV